MKATTIQKPSFRHTSSFRQIRQAKPFPTVGWLLPGLLLAFLG